MLIQEITPCLKSEKPFKDIYTSFEHIKIFSRSNRRRARKIRESPGERCQVSLYTALTSIDSTDKFQGMFNHQRFSLVHYEKPA